MRTEHVLGFQCRPSLAVLAALSCMLLAGCAAAQPKAFSVSVEAWQLCEGYGHRYEVSPSTIQITTVNDFGKQPRTVWQSPLTYGQRKSFTAYLDRLPLASLKEKYDNPNIDDGLGLNFRVKLATTTETSIEVHEAYREDLAGLVDQINALVPPEYKIIYEKEEQPS